MKLVACLLTLSVVACGGTVAPSDDSSRGPLDGAGASTSGGSSGGDAAPAQPAPTEQTCAGLPGNDADLARSPRANELAEWLALRMTGAFVAPQADYERVVRDLGVMHTQIPETAGYTLRPFFTDMGVNVDDATFASIQASTYHDWDCLHARYGWSGQRLDSWTNYVSGQLTVLADTSAVVELYRALPGVSSASGNGWAGDGDRLCATKAGDVVHYVYSRGEGDCPAGCTDRTYRHLSVDAAGTVTDEGTASTKDGALPDWVNRYANGPRCLL